MSFVAGSLHGTFSNLNDIGESYFLKCPVDLFYGCVELPENGRCNDGNQLFSFTDMLQDIECL